MKLTEARVMAHAVSDALDVLARGGPAEIKTEVRAEYGRYYRVVVDGWVASCQGRGQFEENLVGMLLRGGEEET